MMIISRECLFAAVGVELQIVPNRSLFRVGVLSMLIFYHSSHRQVINPVRLIDAGLQTWRHTVNFIFSDLARRQTRRYSCEESW